MSDGKVKFTYFGDGKDLEKELVKLEKKHDDLTNKVNQVSKRSRKASKENKDSLGSQVKSIAAVTGAYEGVQIAIRAATELQRKLSQSIDQTIPKLDEQQLKLQIQAGLTPKQVEGKIPQIKQALLETPSTDLSGAFQLQTQLVSSGFKQEDIDSGAALQTVLDLKAATNQFGEGVGDVKESVSAVAQFLKATGSETTAANIRKIGGNLTQLFEGSDIQFADLTPLAGEASTLSGKGLSTDIQLAAFSALRDVKAAPEAATGLRQVVSRLSSAGESPAKVKALESIGLKPEDIDLIGENLPTALKRLKTAVDSVDEKTGRSAVFNLFGEKGESAGNALLSKLDVIDQRISVLRGTAFERNIELFQKSDKADRQTVNILTEFAERDINQQRGGITFQDARNIQQLQYTQKVAESSNTLERVIATADTLVDNTGISVGESVGLSPKESFKATQYLRDALPFTSTQSAGQALADSVASYFQGGPILKNSQKELTFPTVQDNHEVVKKLDDNKAATEETNRLLKEQNQLLKNQNNNRPPRPVNRNSQGE